MLLRILEHERRSLYICDGHNHDSVKKSYPTNQFHQDSSIKYHGMEVCGGDRHSIVFLTVGISLIFMNTR